MADEMNTGAAPTGTGSPMGSEAPKSEGGSVLSQIETVLAEWMVTKAPFQLPMNVKEIIVKVAPWVTLIFGLMALSVVVGALGLTAVLTPFAMMGGYVWSGFGIVAILFSAATLVLELMAVPGLLHRTRKGWNLVFYASLLSLVGSILSMNLIGGIIGAIIGWYFIFQVREMYH